MKTTRRALLGGLSIAALIAATPISAQALTYFLPVGYASWYQQGATWACDFTQNLGLNNEGYTTTAAKAIVCVRASVSNVLQVSGIYKQVASGIPAMSDLGLQCEPSRTNYVQQSRDLTQAAKWTLSNCTVAKNQTGIDGVANSACLVTVTGPNATITQNITDSSRARWPSIFTAQKGNGAGNNLGTASISMDGGSTTWDCSGTVGGAITRTVATGTQTAANPVCQLKFTTTGDTWLVDCVQIENSGITASSPIYSANAATVRAADNITALDNSMFNGATGALAVEWQNVTGPISSLQIAAQLSIDANNFVRLDTSTANAGDIQVRSGGVTQASFTSAGFVSTGGIFKSAVRWGLNDVAGAFNSTLDGIGPPYGATIASAPVGSSATLYIGQSSANTAQAAGFVRKLTYLPYAAAPNPVVVALAGAANLSPITFTDGQTFTFPSGLTWPTTINGFAVPQAVYWNAATKGFLPTGFADLKPLVNAAIWTATPYYVDVSKPDNSGDGRTTAVRDINAAIALANADGQIAMRIYVKGGDYYQQNSINGLAAVEPNKPSAIIGYGDRVRHWNSTQWTFPNSTDPTFTNSYVGGSVTAGRVFDKLTLNAKGDYTEIPVQAGQAAVDAATGGGWYNDGTQTTLRRADGVRPTMANTFISGNFDTAAFATGTKDQYVSGIDFIGGKNGAFAVLATGNPTKNVALDTITAKYSGDGVLNVGSLRVEGIAGLAITYNCTASMGQSDGFNVHNSGGQLYFMHINPTGWYNGTAVNVSCNFITAHDTNIGIVAGGQGGRCYDGGEVAFVDQSRTYCVGLTVETTAATNGRGFEAVTGSGGPLLMWVESCTITSGQWSYESGGAGTIVYTRNNRVMAGIPELVTGGQIIPF